MKKNDKNNVIKIEPQECYGCQACAVGCPHDCIEMIEDQNGFKIPSVDNGKCVDCGLCMKICPAANTSVENEKINIEVYAVNSKDNSIRRASTSGGVFYSLAESVINKGGYVYGAAFDDEYGVVHICAENLEEVKRCMKSKYVQSDMNDVYKKIVHQSKESLVLFTGTPCQTAAVYNYPGINKENLILVDTVCHGIPSPKLWKKHLNEKEKEYGKIVSVMTRNKEKHGALSAETVIQFEDGREYRKVLGNDEYMKAYMEGLSLRDICYECVYKGKNRASDLTMGDFVTARNYVKEADSFSGMSMLTINTKKGLEIFNSIKEKMEVYRIYTKKPLVIDWTWGVPFPYKGQNEYFYNVCFRDNKTIDRSVKRTNLFLKKKTKKNVREYKSEIRTKLLNLYYKNIFKL